MPDMTSARNPFTIEGGRVVDDERSPAADVSAASMTRLRTPFEAESGAPADRPGRPEEKTVI
ncbi:hypothetical protein [Micromonospora sp. NPDC005237]|uniref:hypothetical protein n=1 Tax=Micromonospora sp. NPDC005237 TaxID=3155113 RepID=UPI0033A9AE7E